MAKSNNIWIFVLSRSPKPWGAGWHSGGIHALIAWYDSSVAAFACLIYFVKKFCPPLQDIDNIHTHYPVAKEDYFKLVRYLDLPVSQSSRPPDVKIPFSSPIGGKLSSWRITMHPFESSHSTAGLFLSLCRILYQISDRFDWEKYFHFMDLALSLRPDILHAPP